MTERPVAPTPEIGRKQAEAADPQSSVWVSANAGAGKTHVLTQRVLRLLLTGVPPAEILCLTYTKAAAAEMRARVTGRLGEWALMAEPALEKVLGDLTGTAPDGEMLRRARTLFAHALDTPGGLKINTIHAFCESVLHRFPLEAGVPFGFAVIEDAERERLIRMAREKVLSEALGGHGQLIGPVDTLFDMLSDHALEKAVATALADMRKLKPVLADKETAKARLRRLVNAVQLADVEALRQAIAADTLLGREDILLFRNELAAPKFNSATPASGYLTLVADPDQPTAEELEQAFFSASGGNARAKLMTAPEGRKYPDLLDRLEREQARLVALKAEITRAELVLRSEALIDVLDVIVGEYERLKRARARLDFDDLVTRTAALFGDRVQGDWVRYKLDAGVTHILVDESQDTNPEQWLVVDALADEFFAGESAAQRPRSLFAVGDPKQSIFSFQGAEPALFASSGDAYQIRAKAAQRKFARIPMQASFRTLPSVLDAVDRVFADPALAAAVLSGGEPVRHFSARKHGGGRVALWPLVEAETAEPGVDAWTPPETSAGLRSPEQRLAETIADAISAWIGQGRVLAQRDRAVRADDVLILVQSRNALFHEIIRALKKRGLPTPGADRLLVGSHIATRDLLALADVMLNPGDDLTLAALLRSPLFDVSEGDLFHLAQGRSGALYVAMRDSTIAGVAEAYERLSVWRRRLDFERPYEFFADVLYAEGGLQRLHRRLGAEVDDVITEFLDLALQHEQADLPSLQGFVAEMRSRKVEIKRELAESGAGVRVMTIHGAKGLEAPVVILADSARKPTGSQTHRALYFAGDADGPLLFHASGKGQHTEETARHYQSDLDAQMAEYWRKLYVGMTRAEDELHVAGILGTKTRPEDAWYGAVASALDGNTADFALAPGLQAKLFPADSAADAFRPAAESGALPAKEASRAIALALPRLPVLLTPSTAARDGDPLDTHTEAAGDADAARRAGIALHALLQHLPGVPEDQRRVVAEAALQSLLAGDTPRHDELVRTALALVADPALAFVFGPESRAEVPILARARRNSEEVLVAGRIDRLVVTAAAVTIVDFKSDATPPTDAGAVPLAYVTQLGLYRAVLTRIFPDRPVLASLLWSVNGKFMPVPTEAMDKATRGVAVC